MNQSSICQVSVVLRVLWSLRRDEFVRDRTLHSPGAQGPRRVVQVPVRHALSIIPGVRLSLCFLPCGSEGRLRCNRRVVVCCRLLYRAYITRSESEQPLDFGVTLEHLLFTFVSGIKLPVVGPCLHRAVLGLAFRCFLVTLLLPLLLPLLLRLHLMTSCVDGSFVGARIVPEQACNLCWTSAGSPCGSAGQSSPRFPR